ncbi:hypothetical protein PCASD_20070 [Puccinia coronata f. sp. avenae]|uniref:Reverse transcriptase domain-containing protein n=1 Tax=Puccinia coronata f. sp. avenae TaxID=200324 RepID=A0A2N5TTN6_9BASI|nr:hypothetical protein PCASD_20070 [Puccinia coronata f. sp. avenae]
MEGIPLPMTRGEALQATPLWPTTIRCEMNLKGWQEALEGANLLPKYADVMHGFLSGFSQGIPPHTLNPPRQYFTPDNHKYATQAREKIEDNICEEIKARRMHGPYSLKQVMRHFNFFRSSPLGAVTNGEGLFRPTNNLSYPHGDPDTPSVNSFVDKNDFKTTWDDFNVVSSYLRSYENEEQLAIFDWAKAYCQIPTAASQWPYLMVKDFNSNLILDTRITFGGVAGCGSFGRPFDTWTKVMAHEFDLVKVFRWVDDNLFFKTPESTTCMADIVARSNTLGVKTNNGKFAEFADKQKFISFVWNAKEKTVHLPEGKLFDRVQQLKHFMGQEEYSFKDVEVMVGRLNHVSKSTTRGLRGGHGNLATHPPDVLSDAVVFHLRSNAKSGISIPS